MSPLANVSQPALLVPVHAQVLLLAVSVNPPLPPDAGNDHPGMESTKVQVGGGGGGGGVPDLLDLLCTICDFTAAYSCVDTRRNRAACELPAACGCRAFAPPVTVA